MMQQKRRKAFWLLKKYSSYTAWCALGEAYKSFVNEWMLAVRRADARDVDAFVRNATKIFLDGKIFFEKGLSKLRQGDKSVWRNTSQGLLSQAVDSVIYAHEVMNPDNYVFDWMKNKELVVAAEKNLDLHVMGLYSVCELSREDLPAYWTWNTIFQPLFEPFCFPGALPEIPAGSSYVVQSGAKFDLDGVYEPEWSDTSGLSVVGTPARHEAVRSNPIIGSVNGDDKRFGCFNYFLAHSKAPLYKEEAGGCLLPVAWRLVWEDKRYCDDTIPGDEAEYLIRSGNQEKDGLRCEADQPCPRAGYWFTPAKLDSRRYFKAGEIMPAFESAYGATIWQWDGDQKA